MTFRRVRPRLHRGRPEPLPGQRPADPRRRSTTGTRPSTAASSSTASRGRKGSKAIRDRQPAWIFEKLRDQMPNFWEADSLALIHIKRGAYGAVRPAAAVAAAVVVLAPYLAVLAGFVAGLALLRSRPDARPAPRLPRLLQRAARRDPRLRALPAAGDAGRLPVRRRGVRRLARPRARRGGTARRAVAAALAAPPAPLPRPQLPHEPRPSRLRVRGPGRARGAGASRRREPPPAPAPRAPLRAWWCACRSGPRPCARRWTATPRSSASWPATWGAATTMWGQPYGSPLEAWLAAPFVAALGPTAEALRLLYFLLGLALVPAAYGLARALDPRAALPAAFLVACPPPYFLLLSALPPPMYPTALLLCAALLIAGRPHRRAARRGRPPVGPPRRVGRAGRPRAVDAPHDGRRGGRVSRLALAARGGPARGAPGRPAASRRRERRLVGARADGRAGGARASAPPTARSRRGST